MLNDNVNENFWLVFHILFDLTLCHQVKIGEGETVWMPSQELHWVVVKVATMRGTQLFLIFIYLWWLVGEPIRGQEPHF